MRRIASASMIVLRTGFWAGFRTGFWVGLSVALGALAASCGPDASGPSDVSGDAVVDAVGDTSADTSRDTADASDIGALPDWGDDDALVAWLEAVVATCPPTSLSTAPVGWETELITSGGCSVRYPAGWVSRLAPGAYECTRDASRDVGYHLVATALPGVDWDEVSLGDELVADLTDTYPDLAVLSAASASDPYGVGIRYRVIIAKLTLGGAHTLAVFKVVHSGCSVVLASCPLTASLTWAPAAELPAWACTLAQIEATLHCPSGGGDTCDEGDCDASCRDDGQDGGTCVGDSCMCM